jgi:lipopolysaccharide transport system permease protein
MKNQPDENVRWDREIIPKRGLLSIPWRELWRYRDLVWLLSRRDLSAQYKQTVLGPLWFVIQPLLATVVFSLVFGRLSMGGATQAGTSKVPHFLFYMSGLIVWGLLAECVNKTSLTFGRNAQLFGKVYFPRLAVPLAQSLTNLAAFSVQFCVFLTGLIFYLVKKNWFADPAHPVHVDPNWRICLLPVMLLMVLMLGLGVGMIVTSISTRYRDLALATSFGVQLWMFGSSVPFPVSAISDPAIRDFLALNPMVPIIEGFRLAFTGFGTVTQAQFATSAITCVAIFMLGVVMFNRTEQNVMDTV